MSLMQKLIAFFLIVVLIVSHLMTSLLMRVKVVVVLECVILKIVIIPALSKNLQTRFLVSEVCEFPLKEEKY